MMETDRLRADAEEIVRESIQEMMPDEAVSQALQGKTFGKGKLLVVAVGKAAWQMAKVASDILGDRIDSGIVVTKYGCVKGEIPRIQCLEAGHPIPDENSFSATEKVIEQVSGLRAEDTVLFLLSGGGSALFEKPLIPAEELKDITEQLLSCGASIVEMNQVRKRLSGVKGGRFAQICYPASIYTIVLSDILGDPLDMIASGPAVPDESTCEEALAVVEKYHLKCSEKALSRLQEETPKELDNVETKVVGSVRALCQAAAKTCQKLGYEPMILTDELDGEAREAGRFLAAIAKSHQTSEKSLAFLAGGETVVHLTGSGKGGRNQELALAAAEGISGLQDTAVFSFGSDGTDGPTDAAGGFVDGMTNEILSEAGFSVYQFLQQNDAYHALEKTGGLIKTGATGTNVNDVSVLLIRRG